MAEEIGEVHQTEDLVIEWKIQNFSGLSVELDKVYCSPSFSFANESWFLSVCPNGERKHKSEGYIGLYLHKKSSGPPITLEYILGLKSGDEEINILDKNCSYCFQKAEGNGYSRFIKRSKLSERKSKIVHSNDVTVVCTLRNPSNFKGSAKTVTNNCSYCKTTLDVDGDILSHLHKCNEFPIQCSKCDDVVALKNWHDHKCQTMGAEGKKILEDFKKLFLKQENCDVVLRVKENEFSAHKAILQARSPVFASTFLHDMKEKATGVVDIEDCDPSVFPDFLCFLYCEDVHNLSKENMFKLFTVADKYDVPDLRSKCLRFIEENLSVDTFCDTITFALQHSEAGLVQLATDFFVKNADKIIVSVKWQAFAVENPTQSNELFIKFVESIKQSNLRA